MPTTTSTKPKQPSSWSRLAAPEDEPAPQDGDSLGERAAEIGEETRERVGRAVTRAGKGLRRASAVLVAPPPGDLEGLLPSVDLPELEEAAPLTSLARRLDREGDLWRGLALRALARAGWADRFTQALSVLAALGCVALAAVTAVGALFGSGSAAPRALLVLCGAAVMIAGAAVVAVTAAGVRRAQHGIAREASRRADLAELRLQRLSALLATRNLDPELYRQALGRFEQDVSAPSG